MIVYLNPEAGGGTASAKWRRIEPQVRNMIGEYSVVTPREAGEIRGFVSSALARGTTDFVAAGGDGTVNAVVAALLETVGPKGLKGIRLGAVGLGSSNDFHKPYQDRIGGIPVKLNFKTTVRHDICLLNYRDDMGEWITRPWIINASIGTTAEANGFFNAPDRVLRFLKRVVPSWAIAYAALRTIIVYQGVQMALSQNGVGGQMMHANVRNLGVVKNPHFTGSLRYDSPNEPNGGRFWIHLLHDVRLPEAIATLAGLARGRFSGHPGTRSWRAATLSVESDTRIAVEADGEVVTTTRADFSISPFALEVCS